MRWRRVRWKCLYNWEKGTMTNRNWKRLGDEKKKQLYDANSYYILISHIRRHKSSIHFLLRFLSFLFAQDFVSNENGKEVSLIENHNEQMFGFPTPSPWFSFPFSMLLPIIDTIKKKFLLLLMLFFHIQKIKRGSFFAIDANNCV